MKKIISLFAIAMAAVSSQAAVQVTYNGAAVADGDVIALTRDSFTALQGIPGFEAKAEFVINGDAPVTIDAQSDAATLSYCTGENCFSLTDGDGDGLFTATSTITSTPETLEVDAKFVLATEIPDVKTYMNLKVADKDGSSVSFKVTLDSNASGIDAIGTTAPTVAIVGNQLTYTMTAPTALAIYNLQGAEVFSAAVAGNGAVDLSHCGAGVYVYRAGNHVGKIIIR